jgi:GLPGLI family protein
MIAQTSKKTQMEVEYQEINNTDLPNQTFATLYIDNNNTIYLLKYSTNTLNVEESEGTTYRLPKDPFEPYTKIDHNKKEIFILDELFGKNFLIKDNYNTLKWNITSESKDIAGHSCVKATTTFRGREWVAWFASDIPVPYGPWKLYGLPGLILETYDVTNMYTIRAVKIAYKRNEIFDKDFKTIYETKNDEPISYQQFVKDYEEYIENTNREIQQQRHPSSPVPPRVRKGLELKFEWEK